MEIVQCMASENIICIYFIAIVSRIMNTNDTRTSSATSGPDNLIVIIIDIFLVCVSVIGVIGNILIIVVICRTRSLRTAMNANLVSLAIADLIVCLFLVPVRIILYNFVYIDTKSIRVLCKIDVFIKTLCDSAQLFMLVATSFERFQSIAKPFEKQGHAKRTSLSLTVAWLISIGLGIFNSLYCGDGATIYPCFVHTKGVFYGHWGDKEKNITLPVGLFCLFLVIVFYSRIMKLLNEHNKTMQKRFKNKVNPTQKINEKSTSNVVIKINSTVHAPIEKGKQTTNKTADGVRATNGKLDEVIARRSMNNSVAPVDSGYNENEAMVRMSDPKLKKGSCSEATHKPVDKTIDTQVQTKTYDSLSLDMKQNVTEITSKSAGVSASTIDSKKASKQHTNPLNSWKNIIKDHLFRTGTKPEQTFTQEHLAPITILNVKETKRFPLIRERVTLADIEQLGGNNMKQKNNYNQFKLHTISLANIRRTKSASEMYETTVLNKCQTQNQFISTSFSLGTLHGKDSMYKECIKAAENQIHITESTTFQTISSRKPRQNDTDSGDKSHVDSIGNMQNKFAKLHQTDQNHVNSNQASVPTDISQNSVRNSIFVKDEVPRNFAILNAMDLKSDRLSDTTTSQQKFGKRFVDSKSVDDVRVVHKEGCSDTNNHKGCKENDVSSIKGKSDQDHFRRVEVVDMDGTIHKKVKVESGAVVGAVCVMNNSNRVQGKRKVEMRTAKNIAILIGTFILLWLPLPVFVISVSSSIKIMKVPVEPVLIIASVSTLTVALNPILNVLLNKQMRSRTISTLSNCKRFIR